MIVDLNEPSEDKMPIGIHINPVTGEERFFWTGKVAIGVRRPTHQPYFTPLPRSERLELAAALKEKCNGR